MHWYGFPTAEKLRRAEAWVAAWSVVQHSTEPVDHERAERAMTALYGERGLAAPRFLWVGNPADGLMAWHLGSRGRAPLRNPWTKGDWGTGANRSLHQLRDPFGLEPAWQHRALLRAESCAPTGFSFDAGYSANGEALRAAFDDATRDHAAAQLDGGGTEPAAALAPLDEAMARRVIGDRWESLKQIVGDELLTDVAVRAVVRSAADILDVNGSRREAMLALTLPQFDRVTIAMGALPEVLGVAQWRQLDEREERTAMVERRLELARSGAAFWALEGLAIMMERPSSVGFDERGRLHAAERPALAYPDDLRVWADHGVVVPRRIIEDPGSITVGDIDSQTNAEIRRVMTERFGPDRLIREGGADLVGEDETGRLWRRRHAHTNWRDEALVMVEVQNSTPEPNGSVRTYFLRVPPSVRTAREAVAWTFGLDGPRYAPVVQT
jgi:hypothetical protein